VTRQSGVASGSSQSAAKINIVQINANRSHAGVPPVDNLVSGDAVIARFAEGSIIETL
jgi:hypothetical protein